MIGHNWGSEHAERWVWLEGTGFEGEPDTYFDAGAARIALGSRTTPWIPSGMLVLDGEAHRLGGLGKVRPPRSRRLRPSCSFVLPGKDIVVRGRVSAPKKDFVGWVYADPKGPEHNTVNCSVADLELTVERPAARPAPRALRRRRLRAGHARDRPRHPDPALSGRLSHAASRGRSLLGDLGCRRPRRGLGVGTWARPRGRPFADRRHRIHPLRRACRPLRRRHCGRVSQLAGRGCRDRRDPQPGRRGPAEGGGRRGHRGRGRDRTAGPFGQHPPRHGRPRGRRRPRRSPPVRRSSVCRS